MEGRKKEVSQLDEGPITAIKKILTPIVKRKEIEVYKEGWKAYENDKSHLDCPYTERKFAAAWMKGYNDTALEYKTTRFESGVDMKNEEKDDFGFTYADKIVDLIRDVLSKNNYETLELHTTASGYVQRIRDNQDGREYEIIVKPIDSQEESEMERKRIYRRRRRPFGAKTGAGGGTGMPGGGRRNIKKTPCPTGEGPGFGQGGGRGGGKNRKTESPGDAEFNAGVKACYEGKDITECPYKDPSSAERWLQGFIAGEEKKEKGLTLDESKKVTEQNQEEPDARPVLLSNIYNKLFGIAEDLEGLIKRSEGIEAIKEFQTALKHVDEAVTILDPLTMHPFEVFR